ncbi:MAG: hypothetical protein U0165_13915 [Polyangiaceae bacterium]
MGAVGLVVVSSAASAEPNPQDSTPPSQIPPSPPATAPAASTEAAAPSPASTASTASTAPASSSATTPAASVPTASDPSNERVGEAARWQIGASVGIQIPTGKVARSLDIQDAIGVGPLASLQVGYHLNPRWALVYQASGALSATKPKLCPESVDCATSVLLTSILGVRHYLDPFESFTPWIGVGLGIDATLLGQKSTASKQLEVNGKPVESWSHGYIGPALLLEGGADHKLSRHWDIGPYGSLTVGEYLTQVTSIKPVSTDGKQANSDLSSSAIGSPRPHVLITFGLRLAYVPLLITQV